MKRRDSCPNAHDRIRPLTYKSRHFIAHRAAAHAQFGSDCSVLATSSRNLRAGERIVTRVVHLVRATTRALRDAHLDRSDAPAAAPAWPPAITGGQHALAYAWSCCDRATCGV